MRLNPRIAWPDADQASTGHSPLLRSVVPASGHRSNGRLVRGLQRGGGQARSGVREQALSDPTMDHVQTLTGNKPRFFSLSLNFGFFVFFRNFKKPVLDRNQYVWDNFWIFRFFFF